MAVLSLRLKHGRHDIRGLTGANPPAYLYTRNRREHHMREQTRKSRILELFDLFGSAIAVAGAADNGHRPKARDLRRLGIDPAQWGRIGR
ncbi:MAG TPA: hypothetical protein VGN97_09060 [Mesorhizobium sp.]|nr:hypothetical protein [Mesorhizobium sp.]